MNEAKPLSPKMQGIQSLFQTYVVPTYDRFPICLAQGKHCEVWDVDGKRYLDFGAGIAVSALGHGHRAISEALFEQAQRLIHCSNLYHIEQQALLAKRIVALAGPGKCFFPNSGAEANETLYKLARKFGNAEGRYEVITAFNSFHGRTLGGISATGQDKVKTGFEPMVEGFKHVPFNDLPAIEAAVGPKTAAVLIEVIQGEGGITPASPDYLMGLRRLCDEKKLLLLFDEVQCGYFRTGRFLSFQRILENIPGGENFLPDAVSMAKAIAGGIPMGAVWIREPFADILGAGSHGSTFGGTPLACSVALRILDVVEQEGLQQNVRQMGEYLREELEKAQRAFPAIIKSIRGIGFMVGLELADPFPGCDAETKPASAAVKLLNEAGLLTIPSGRTIIRILPPLIARRGDVDEAMSIMRKVFNGLSA